MSALRLEAIRKTFGPIEVIKGVDLEVEGGEFVVFVGPSGCGKSTLLRIIAGLEEQSFGHVFIHDKNVDVTPPARREIAMVFQTYALYPHLTVRGNMELGLKQAKVPQAEIERRVKEAARMLHLDAYESRKPQALSGGQRQRVAIGRAIVREPKLFLFDEPLSNLDAALRVNTRVEIAKLRRMLQTTIIYVTHDQIEAMTLADRIVVLNEGRIEQIGTPLELYHRPANMFVAGFIGSPKMNFQGGDQASSFGAKTIGVRPEHLALVEPEAALWTGTVAHSERLGADTFLYVETGQDDLMTVRRVGDINIPPGATVHLAAAGPVHRFDDKGVAMGAAA